MVILDSMEKWVDIIFLFYHVVLPFTRKIVLLHVNPAHSMECLQFYQTLVRETDSYENDSWYSSCIS